MTLSDRLKSSNFTPDSKYSFIKSPKNISSDSLIYSKLKFGQESFGETSIFERSFKRQKNAEDKAEEYEK